jgi:hypothetical protein
MYRMGLRQTRRGPTHRATSSRSTPAGAWPIRRPCEGGNLNPMIDLSRPPAGQYDVWVGSYRAGESIAGTFFVTELSGNRP